MEPGTTVSGTAGCEQLGGEVGTPGSLSPELEGMALPERCRGPEARKWGRQIWWVVPNKPLRAVSH